MSNNWKMVPVDPTEEMNKAGMRWLTGFQHMRANDKRNALTEAFKAMVSDAPQPPALGGDLEDHLLEEMSTRFELHKSDDNWLCVDDTQLGVEFAADFFRVHVAQLQAEIQRLKEESFEQLYNQVIDERDRSEARTAELERVLGIVEDTLPHISGESRTVSNLLFTVQQTLAYGKCCTATAEEQQLLASGEYTPEEIFGAGGKPSCPKCHGQKAALTNGKEPGKPCAAEWQGHQCSSPRAEDSLFCPQHRSVDGRQRMGGDPLTNEQLAFMMQSDGEIQ